MRHQSLAKNNKENGTLEAWTCKAPCKIEKMVDVHMYKNYISNIISIKCDYDWPESYNLENGVTL